MKKTTIKDLRNITQAHCFGPDIPLYIKFLRIYSIYLTAVFLCLGLSANTVTLIGIFLSPLSAVLMINGLEELSILCIIISVLCDYSDGEVARYRKMLTKEGIFLDKVHHIVVPSVFFYGVMVWLQAEQGGISANAFGGVYILASIFFPFINHYAVDVAVNSQIIQHIKCSKINNKQLRSTDAHKNEQIKTTPKKLGRAFSYASQIADFPINIFILSLVIIADLYIFQNVSYKHQAVSYFFYIGAISVSALCTATLFRIIYIRHIENEYTRQINSTEN